MYIFIDESGDHNLQAVWLDNKYNIFVLGALCIEEAEYIRLDTEFRAIKEELFWNSNFIIHTAEITRPSRGADERNLLFNDRGFRERFYKGMTELIENIDFEVIACAIRKDDFVGKYGIFNAQDPYLFSIENLLNRILWINKWPHKIYPEKRGKPLDQILELEVLKYKTMWTRFHRGAEIIEAIDEFVLKDKSVNMSWQQLIDLIVSPIWRHILGKSPKPLGNEIPFQSIKSKIRPKNLTIFP